MGSQPTVVDLFCGAGGLSAGFQDLGFKILVGVDIDAPSCSTFTSNHPTASVINSKIQSVTSAAIAAFVKGKRPDVVIGGPSCQGFSTVGPRNLEDPRNQQFKEFVRVVRDLKPECFLMENVVGLLLYNKGVFGKQICKLFGDLGYRTEAKILLAADFGVPQLRRRVFFIGTRKKNLAVPFPKPTHCDPELWEDYALPFTKLSSIGQKNADEQLPRHLTVSDAISDLPALGEQDGADDCPYSGAPKSPYQVLMRTGSSSLRHHMTSRMSESERKMVRVLKPGDNWRSLPPDLLPERFTKIRPYDATTLIMRMRWDKPAYTITTKSAEVTSGAFIHPDQNRTLSVREAARLQSFPDRFVFCGTQDEQRRQIGNSVPPLLAQRLAEAVLCLLGGNESLDENRLCLVEPEPTLFE